MDYFAKCRHCPNSPEQFAKSSFGWESVGHLRGTFHFMWSKICWDVKNIPASPASVLPSENFQRLHHKQEAVGCERIRNKEFLGKWRENSVVFRLHQCCPTLDHGPMPVGYSEIHLTSQTCWILSTKSVYDSLLRHAKSLASVTGPKHIWYLLTETAQ